MMPRKVPRRTPIALLVAAGFLIVLAWWKVGWTVIFLNLGLLTAVSIVLQLPGRQFVRSRGMDQAAWKRPQSQYGRLCERPFHSQRVSLQWLLCLLELQ